ncbi:bifunctional adenosylcobinamide kinase/adenosylcobinamide-phosphate guanylyltransferase, partial [Ottowia sp.]|uniref:bifunctional adenosylcobinamide kinase/adenosylcobinamide-phosphate guanylyltransferase n=1 Tax=Ottowia sp. TaxID=1898956 RepID=UPI0039E368B4
MEPVLPAPARSELILGGQKSGKSRRAESLAAVWLAAAPAHRAVLIATAEPHDDEMRARIARHQRERAARVPGLATREAPRDLPAAISEAGGAETLRVV